MFNLANALHPPANDTYELGDDKKEVTAGALPGPAYTMITPIPVRDFGKALAIFQIFSPHYIMGKEQCFWLCSCITFILSSALKKGGFTRAALTRDFTAFKSSFEEGTFGSAWGIRLKQDHKLTQIIAELARVIHFLEGRTAVIPAAMEEDWRKCAFAPLLQVTYSSCEAPHLKALAAKGLALAIVPTSRSYVDVTKKEVVTSLLGQGGIADADDLTLQGLLSIVQASQGCAQKLLNPVEDRPSELPPPRHLRRRQISDSFVSMADGVLGNPVMDPAVETLAHVIGSIPGGCEFVVEKCPQAVETLLDVLTHCSKPVHTLPARPSSHMLEMATNAIRNISTLKQGSALLREKAHVVLEPYTLAPPYNINIQQEASAAIKNLAEPSGNAAISPPRDASAPVSTVVFRTATNLVSFDRSANVERAAWIRDRNKLTSN
jgi:hypothetical protein